MGLSLKDRYRHQVAAARSRLREKNADDQQAKADLNTFVDALARAGKRPNEINRLAGLYAQRLAGARRD